MNQAEFVEAIAKDAHVPQKDVAAVVRSFVNVTSRALIKGDKVKISGFGTFETAKRAARIGHNPQTGEKISIPASITPKFKHSKTLKDLLN